MAARPAGDSETVTHDAAVQRGFPGISPRIMAALLNLMRASIAGPGRMYIICSMHGRTLRGCYVCPVVPEKLAEEVPIPGWHRLLLGYEIGAVIPVLLSQTEPAPCTFLALARLPWGPKSPGGWCVQCGGRLPEGDGAHACP